MSAPYACWRSAIWPGLDCVVSGGRGAVSAAGGAPADDRRRRTSSPSPATAAAATSGQGARLAPRVMPGKLDAQEWFGERASPGNPGENYVVGYGRERIRALRAPRRLCERRSTKR